MTTGRLGLGRSELVTTALAFLVSSALWVSYGHPYLARGVLGDLLGLAGLTVVLWATRRRGRHEALCCLAAIGLVAALSPDWPLRVHDVVWWTAVAVAVAGYVAVRQRVLTGSQTAGRRPASAGRPAGRRRR
ncbi:MAG: hypothetical protein AB1679_23440 [Actinomycetota bacterium]